MSPRISNSSTTSLCTQNSIMKRSFSELTESDIEDDIIHKNKICKHSQEVINNAILTSSNGYMTRNRLKKQLTGNNKCERSITKKKAKNRESRKKGYDKKIQQGYVFTYDISLPYSGTQVIKKKNIPLLFESDSESDIDYFQINDSTKILNEIKENSITIPKIEYENSKLNKSNDVKTYFNKKSYSFNNTTNITSSNSFKARICNQSQQSLNLINQVKNGHNANYEKELQKDEIPNLPIFSDPTTNNSMEGNINDGYSIIVTEEFIKQLLEKELKTENTVIKDTFMSPEISFDTSTINLDVSNYEQHKDDDILSMKSEVFSLENNINQNNTCMVDTDIDINNTTFNTSNSNSFLLEKEFNINEIVQCKQLEFNTTIVTENCKNFDNSKQNVSVKNYDDNFDDEHQNNTNEFYISNFDFETSSSFSKTITKFNNHFQTKDFENSNLESHSSSEKNKEDNSVIQNNTPCDLITNKSINTIIHKKEENLNILISKTKLDSIKNFDLNFKIDNSNNFKNVQLNVNKCKCKIFYEFNKDANEILTSKTKHIAFNNNTKKNRQKFLHLKNLEANILKILITENKKNILSKKLVTNEKPISMSCKEKECIDFNKNDHIDPSILNILKDVYVDVEYLPGYNEYNKTDNSYVNNQTQRSNNLTQNFNTETKIEDLSISKKNELFTNKIDKSFIEDQTQRSNNITQNFKKETKIEDTSKKNELFTNKIDKSFIEDQTQRSNNITQHFKKETKIEDTSKKNELFTNKIDKFFIEDETQRSYNVTLNFNDERNIEDISISKKNKTEFNSNNDKIKIFGSVLKCKKLSSSFPKIKSNCVDLITDQLEINNMQNSSVMENNVDINNIPVKTNTINSNSDISRIKENLKCNNDVPKLFKNEISKNMLTFPEPPIYKNKLDYIINFNENEIIKTQVGFVKKNLGFTQSHFDEQPKKILFDISTDDFGNSLNNNSSDEDDDDKLQIADTEFNENNFKNPQNKSLTEINIMEDKDIQNNKTLKLKEQNVSNKHEHKLTLEKKNMPLTSILDIKTCNDFYKKRKLINNSKYLENEYFSKNIKDIFTEMYIDEMFVFVCQHMVELCDDEIQFENLKSEKVCDIKLQIDENKIYPELNQLISTNVGTSCNTVFNNNNQFHNKQNSITENVILSQKVDNKSISIINSKITQKISTNEEIMFETKIDNINQQENKSTTKIENIVSKQEPPREEIIHPKFIQSFPNNIETVNDHGYLDNNNHYVTPTTEKINFKSPNNKNNTKSNIEIRLQFREFINSNISVSKILESKEFQNLRFFKEEEIANSIGVFCFEQILNPPIINGLSTYRINYDQSNNEEKNKLLGSTNLNITCPKIMKLTSITLALVKMLRSDTLIDLILTVIRKNLLNKHMNTDHTIDNQLMTQIVYFVDICIRLRLLKTLQTFIFDSMVMLPNKYCCVIFICLLLWTNCLPKRINDEQDPVIIMILSCLIAKKKLYSEQTVGCDIFQRELINLLSFHFNYTFTVDLPINFIQHVNKPDFFISVVIFLKCCNPKDLAEFTINCLLPIIDDYLNTQQNETNAVKLMESINMSLKPFNMSCNATVATYLNKCKGLINSSKKNEKEHIYNSMYHSYRILQTKFIEYLNDSRSRSQVFEESLVSVIMLLGSVDFATSCATIIKWKPIFKQSTISLQKLNLFKSIMDCALWDKLCLLEDTTTIKCLINSCLLKKNVYNTILRIQAIR